MLASFRVFSGPKILRFKISMLRPALTLQGVQDRLRIFFLPTKQTKNTKRSKSKQRQIFCPSASALFRVFSGLNRPGSNRERIVEGFYRRQLRRLSRAGEDNEAVLYRNES